jgi:hypothetical protein
MTKSTENNPTLSSSGTLTLNHDPEFTFASPVRNWTSVLVWVIRAQLPHNCTGDSCVQCSNGVLENYEKGHASATLTFGFRDINDLPFHDRLHSWV